MGESGFGKKAQKTVEKKASERGYVLHVIGECQESDGGNWDYFRLEGDESSWDWNKIHRALILDAWIGG